jgi:NAD(P)H-dependent FMN reductase
MANLLVIIASTRPGRAGLPIGTWFSEVAVTHGGFDVACADLAEIDLPFLDEPAHPRLGQYTKDHTHAWSRTVSAADAVVIVTSEYNYGYPASLKNAIDYLSREWSYKPIGFVSYGGVAGGTRSVQQLKQVVTALKMFPVTEAVPIPFHTQSIDAAGVFTAAPPLVNGAHAMLDELVRVEAALRPLRDLA